MPDEKERCKMDKDLEQFCDYYDLLPVHTKILMYCAMWGVSMTRSSAFYIVCVLSIIALVLLAAVLDYPPLYLVAGMGIGGIIVTMIVVTILNLFLNSHE